MAKDVGMVDPVERRRQIRVQHPPPLRALAVGGHVDHCDRVMAATAGPKPIRPRLEPRLPLGLQRAHDTCLLHAINDHGDTERTPLPAAALLRDVHPLDGTSAPRPGAALHPFDQIHLGLGAQQHLTVNARRLAASITLAHSPHAEKRVGTRTTHQLRFRCHRHQSSSQAHLTASAPFRVRATHAPYPASYPGRPAEGQPYPVFRRLSATGIRFSVIRFPPGSWAFLTVGLLGQKPGPRRGYHVPHARAATGVGAPCIPRTAMLTRLTCIPQPAPAASQRPVPAPRYYIPSSRAP